MRQMARDTLIETLVIVLVITFVVMFLATSFVRPVNDLIARVQLARSGKPDVSFATETGDEIGDLARSFRELIDGVQKQAMLLEQATAQNQRLLENVMPKGMVQRVKAGHAGITEQIDDVSVVFAELKGLAEYTRATSDTKSVAALRQLTGAFDESAARHGVERVKTVGDTYLAVTGLSQPMLDHMRRAVEFALAARSIVLDFNRSSGAHLGVTVGICAGPVVADVLGQGQFLFQLWGAAVIDADYAMDCGGINEIVVTRSVRDGLADQYRFESLQTATPDVPLWRLVGHAEVPDVSRFRMRVGPTGTRIGREEYRSEAAAGRAEIGRLPLIQARGDQQHVAVVDVVAQVDFENRRAVFVGAETFARWHQCLRDVVAGENLGKNPPRDFFAAVCAAAAETARGFEKQPLAIAPQCVSVCGVHASGARDVLQQTLRQRCGRFPNGSAMTASESSARLRLLAYSA